MPIYLLAEDEGNEEAILRLLELESPGGSRTSSPQDSAYLCPGDDDSMTSSRSSPHREEGSATEKQHVESECTEPDQLVGVISLLSAAKGCK